MSIKSDEINWNVGGSQIQHPEVLWSPGENGRERDDRKTERTAISKNETFG